jgi:hypothetical protein
MLTSQIFRLHMKTAVKFQVFGILLLAFAAFAASIVRFILVVEIIHATYTESFDIDRKFQILSGSQFSLNTIEETNSTLFYWGMIEAGIALIACCLPVLKPLVSDKGVGSVVASIRSRVTLRSNRSNASQDSKTWPRATETTGTYSKMSREGSLAAPLKEEDIEMQNHSSRGPSGEHGV